MKDSYRGFLAEGERAGMRYTLSVPRDAVSGLVGFEMGRKAGTSLDFKDYREYQPGDDLRHIDWHVYARSDKLTVKLFREEVSPHLDIVVDGSKSMALENTEKARATLGLAAVFAVAAGNAGCSHCCWLAGRDIRRVVAGNEFPSLWDGIDFDFAGDPASAFGAAPAWRRNGIRVFISDLLWPAEPLFILRNLSDGAAAVIVVQVLAKPDSDAPEPGSTSLLDIESGETLELFVDATASARYASALALHQQNWRHACRQTGAFMASLQAEDAAATWRLDALERAMILGAV